jgi:hypothetical protein
MKKILVAAALTASLSGCAIGPYQGGFLYSDISAPLDVRDNAVACTKKGTSSMSNILGLFGAGDAGIEKAKANGGITKVGSVDVHYMNFLTLYTNTTTTVCGE